MKKIIKKIARKFGMLGVNFQKRHKGVEKRWEILSEYLPEKESWVLDIGSNYGDTSIRCAKMGHYTIGIEPFKEFFRSSHKKAFGRVAFMNESASPDFFEKLIKFDVIFMLSVFHRMWALNGPEYAKKCLKYSLQKSNIILFEGSTRLERYNSNSKFELPDFNDLDIEASILWHKSIFDKICDKNWKIEYLGNVNHTKSEPYRILFKLERK